MTAQPDADGDELEGCGIVFREFVVSGGDTAEVFDLVEEALDEVACLAALLREADRVFPVAPWRDVRRGLPVGDGGPHETQAIWRHIGFRAGFGRSPQALRRKRKGGPKATRSIAAMTIQIMSYERTTIVSKPWNA